MTEKRKFPVHETSHNIPLCPKFVNWDALDDEAALHNHAQDLETLAARGGLSLLEIVANLKGVSYWDAQKTSEDDAIKMVLGIKWHPPRAETDYSSWYRLDKDKEILRRAIAAAAVHPGFITSKDHEFLAYLGTRDAGKCIYKPHRQKLIKLCLDKLQIVITEDLK